ncbi:hypothetical protein [Actinomadura rupiterrae]|uniref:hypothetical protein n=1 Tax=Actinomadura rupiterrae TaxID=559627 RepID=UPI0020A39B61|nr:hypothetical protein [Actinomadura rupiterrae]MCP2335839.1 hypothetical protein [Actinomadura rupiterrae]
MFTKRAFLAVLFAAGGTAATALPAAAAPAAPDSAGAVARQAMTVQCRVADPRRVTSADLADDASVAALCHRLGVRGSGVAAPAGGMGAANYVHGNCGTSGLFIRNWNNGGHPVFAAGAWPTPSHLSHGSATIHWHNLSKGGRSSFHLAVWANTGGWAWRHSEKHFTKTGTVFAYMTGDVMLVDGRICSIARPTDTENVH